MLSNSRTPEHSVGALPPPVNASKPKRVLSCVLCAQKKIKCDRNLPCANCTKAKVQCVSAATLSRQRRRRFPERELLDRLRHYEDLLRKNNIPFHPLHTSPTTNYSFKSNDEPHTRMPESEAEGRATVSEESTTGGEESRAKSFWHVMTQMDQDNDDSNESGEEADNNDSLRHVLRREQVAKVWDEIYDIFHPSQAHILKLWQLYLENVDPLLKVTSPTLQSRIIDAAGNVTSIRPELEALMFSIYSIAVLSLDREEFQATFGMSKEDALREYQFGAREALLNCDFLKTNDRDCLTALHIYLITLKLVTDPRSLSSILAAVIRIAQRMGIDTEAENCKHSVLEAELRRRLWWSIVLYDTRMAEMTDMRTATLTPTWDCKIPLNVNDFNLRTGTKSAPTECSVSSEALFVVIRSRIGNFIRNDPSHLDFVNPVLKSIARKNVSDSNAECNDLTTLESILETNYLRECDPTSPLHFVTLWTARLSLAKTRFTQYLSACCQRLESQTDDERDAGLAHVRTMLECDTNLMSSSLIKGFRWLLLIYFPFPAYAHLVQDLRKRPLGDHVGKAWQVMSDNYAVRFRELERKDGVMDKKPESPFFKTFAALILQAWYACESASDQKDISPPPIVTQIRQILAYTTASSQARAANVDGQVSMDIGSFYSQYTADGLDVTSQNADNFLGPAQVPGEFQSTQWAWHTTNWDTMSGQAW